MDRQRVAVAFDQHIAVRMLVRSPHQDKYQVRPAVALLKGRHVGSQSSNGAHPPSSWPSSLSCHSILAI